MEFSSLANRMTFLPIKKTFDDKDLAQTHSLKC